MFLIIQENQKNRHLAADKLWLHQHRYRLYLGILFLLMEH